MGYDINHIKGNTLEKIDFECKVNQLPLDLTNATIEMKLYKNPFNGESPTLSMTSVGNDGITITDALLGKFKINDQVINIEPYLYSYNIKMTLQNGEVKTYISGFFNVTL